MGAGYNPVQGGGCVMLRKVRLYGQLAEFVGRKVMKLICHLLLKQCGC